MARRTKWLWTDEEKRLICFQTAAEGVSVAQVARRYAPLIDTAYRLPGSG
jgi:transposase